MKAIVYTQYGPPDVLRFEEVPKPAPQDNEILIQLRAASVNPLDFHNMRGHVRMMSGLRSPKETILGCDIAGQVEAVGKDVTQFQPGDEVFGVTGFGGRGFAEYVCAKQDKLALKPSNISFEEAAAVPIAGLTALQGLRDKGRIQPGQKVAIDGASGGVGTFAVQIAKAFGAEVAAVCSSSKLETARSIGADHLIDYTQEDFTRSGRVYDLILGANAHHPVFDYRRVLSPDGIFVGAGGPAKFQDILQSVLVAPFLSLFWRQKMRVFIAKINKKDLDVLKDLLASGKVVSVIDRSYPLSAAAEAMRYLEEGHARGKIILIA
jgi:NADPH:quinone reductase-like Zn-dependent oxidoreductase